MARTISFITLDIETISGPDYPTPNDIKPTANMKKPETIEAYKNNPVNLETAYRKQALVSYEGRVHTIGYKLDGDPVKSLWHDGSDEEGLFRRWEEDLVKEFQEHYGNDTIYGVTFVGFNIKSFDAVWLFLRAKKYRCEKLLRIMGNSPQDVKLEDVMRWMVFNSYRDYISLDNAYKFFFNKSAKDGIDGSMVHDMWRAGKHQEIAKYCEEDVDRTYELAVHLGIINPK